MTGSDTVHATAVAFAGRGVLIRGPSGAGKSALALDLMAVGAVLIADDRVQLTRRGDHILASCPPVLSGLIEARGLGLLRAAVAGPTALACVVDLDVATEDRLPPRRTVTVLGCDLPLIYRPAGVSFAPALLQYLRAGLADERARQSDD
ncbi:HPr kinase/phosphorylase [Loktanella sp. DJP18]|uniref:HPr kinase/phosphorylase n=1 Tax=Loktanella sp. DJP18 TaxID=3409788 RepID=UPI003BB81397